MEFVGGTGVQPVSSPPATIFGARTMRIEYQISIPISISPVPAPPLSLVSLALSPSARVPLSLLLSYINNAPFFLHLSCTALISIPLHLARRTHIYAHTTHAQHWNLRPLVCSLRIVGRGSQICAVCLQDVVADLRMCRMQTLVTACNGLATNLDRRLCVHLYGRRVFTHALALAHTHMLGLRIVMHMYVHANKSTFATCGENLDM